MAQSPRPSSEPAHARRRRSVLLERAETLEDGDVRRFLRKWHIAEDPGEPRRVRPERCWRRAV